MLIPIGYHNYVETGKIVAIMRTDTAPVRRLVEEARRDGAVVDGTFGRPTRSVIVTTAGIFVLSAADPGTLARRRNGGPNDARTDLMH